MIYSTNYIRSCNENSYIASPIRVYIKKKLCQYEVNFILISQDGTGMYTLYYGSIYSFFI